MNLQISVAKTAGFCFGVKRAVEMAYALAAEKVPACTYGELIHNPQVVEELREKGLPPVDSLDSCTGKTVLLRSHGVPAHVYQELENRGCKVIDATCPFVERIHKIVSQAQADETIIIAGDENHPEVKGIMSFCSGPYIEI